MWSLGDEGESWRLCSSGLGQNSEPDPQWDDSYIRSLFIPFVTGPERARLLSALSGHHGALAIVSKGTREPWCVLRTGFGRVFVGGRITKTALSSALKHLREHGPLFLDDSHGIKGREIQRIEYSGEVDQGTLRAQLAGIPDAMELQELNDETLPKSHFREHCLRLYGDTEGALRHSLGNLILNESGWLVAETCVMFSGNGEAELVSWTHQDYRRRHLATIATAATMLRCKAYNLRPYWSCDADNRASAAVAGKLGFPFRRQYRIIEQEAEQNSADAGGA